MRQRRWWRRMRRRRRSHHRPPCFSVPSASRAAVGSPIPKAMRPRRMWLEREAGGSFVSREHLARTRGWSSRAWPVRQHRKIAVARSGPSHGLRERSARLAVAPVVAAVTSALIRPGPACQSTQSSAVVGVLCEFDTSRCQSDLNPIPTRALRHRPPAEHNTSTYKYHPPPAT